MQRCKSDTSTQRFWNVAATYVVCSWKEPSSTIDSVFFSCIVIVAPVSTHRQTSYNFQFFVTRNSDLFMGDRSFFRHSDCRLRICCINYFNTRDRTVLSSQFQSSPLWPTISFQAQWAQDLSTLNQLETLSDVDFRRGRSNAESTERVQISALM